MNPNTCSRRCSDQPPGGPPTPGRPRGPHQHPGHPQPRPPHRPALTTAPSGCGGCWTAWTATGSRTWPPSTPAAAPPTTGCRRPRPPAGCATTSSWATPPPPARSAPPGRCSAAPHQDRPSPVRRRHLGSACRGPGPRHKGLLDPEAGQILLAALEPLARPPSADDPRSGTSGAPTPSRSWPGAPWRPASCPSVVGCAPAAGHRGPGQPG